MKPNSCKNTSVVRSLVFNNEAYSDELEMVQIFNQRFSTVAKKLHESIPILTTGCSFTSYLADFPSHESFCFALVSATVIENVIMFLKNKRNKIYTYSVEALKTIKSLASPMLVHIIKLFLSTG